MIQKFEICRQPSTKNNAIVAKSDIKNWVYMYMSLIIKSSNIRCIAFLLISSHKRLLVSCKQVHKL